MTRKATAKKPKKKVSKKPAQPKPVIAYIAVREISGEVTSYTEPDRVFADKKAARAHADELNRQLRGMVNPFEDRSAEYLLKGGEKALKALVKKLKLPAPKATTSYGYTYVEWDKWWDRHYFDMTDAQREAVWDALDKFNWYTVKSTELE